MSDLKEVLQKQKDYFSRGETLDVSFRLQALTVLKRSLHKHEKEIIEALKKDLNKSPFESYATEIGMIMEELNYTLKYLRKWTAVKKVKTPIIHFKSNCYILAVPYGTTLIMSPWNYPVQLALLPLVGSIAGGNCSVLKPSSYSSNASATINKIIKDCYDEEYISVVEGGREANKALLAEKFDYIFFTGSVSIGRVVMESAARHLTPVTLELGGKSPCIVEKDANIDLAARRIAWGKFLNAGQTCVAPDYILVHRDVKKALMENLKKYIREFYGTDPCKNEDYPRIINDQHFARIRDYLSLGEKVIGGNFDEDKLCIEPTILDGIKWEDSIMQEEIFGPVLPVLEYDNLSSAIEAINSRSKPLALYLFTSSKETEDRVIRRISFGGGCVNDAVVHLATSNMPFGGVGESGIGNYHGKWSFETFTHQKSILKKSNFMDIKLRYPPYKEKLRQLKKIYNLAKHF